MKKKPALVLQVESLYRDQSPGALSRIHNWLCHPGHDCEDGCDAEALPERLAAHEAAEIHR